MRTHTRPASSTLRTCSVFEFIDCVMYGLRNLRRPNSHGATHDVYLPVTTAIDAFYEDRIHRRESSRRKRRCFSSAISSLRAIFDQSKLWEIGCFISSSLPDPFFLNALAASAAAFQARSAHSQPFSITYAAFPLRSKASGALRSRAKSRGRSCQSHRSP